MSKMVLALAIVSAAFFSSAGHIFAEGESESWTKIFVRGAQADFSITHKPNLKTSGSVQISQTVRGSAFTGAELIEKIRLYAALTICDNGEQCRKIWIVEAERLFDFPAPFTINEENAQVLSAEVQTTVTVYDFTDADNNGDFSDVTGSFGTNLTIDMSWDGVGNVGSPTTTCNWDDGIRLAEGHSKQESGISGTIGRRPLTGLGSIYETESWRIFKPGHLTPC